MPDGKIRCAYCEKERPQSEMKQAVIIFQTRQNGKAIVGRKTNYYCADSGCAGYDQMAHEG